MKKMIRVRKGGFVYLKEFADVIDVDKIDSYKVKKTKDGTLILTFYDEKKKLVKAYDRSK